MMDCLGDVVQVIELKVIWKLKKYLHFKNDNSQLHERKN
jgi:hypothetical protein